MKLHRFVVTREPAQYNIATNLKCNDKIVGAVSSYSAACRGHYYSSPMAFAIYNLKGNLVYREEGPVGSERGHIRGFVRKLNSDPVLQKELLKILRSNKQVYYLRTSDKNG